jgi:hypothetical protein
MWTFDNPPRKQWKERYDFQPTDTWLDHVRLASVRLNDGGSGCFVSSGGLLMTNQHVAGTQLQKVSTKEKDYTRDGFYARTRSEELKCPDLEVNVLVSYEDVTRSVENSIKRLSTRPTEASLQSSGLQVFLTTAGVQRVESGKSKVERGKWHFLVTEFE